MVDDYGFPPYWEKTERRACVGLCVSKIFITGNTGDPTAYGGGRSLRVSRPVGWGIGNYLVIPITANRFQTMYPHRPLRPLDQAGAGYLLIPGPTCGPRLGRMESTGISMRWNPKGTAQKNF